MGSYKIPERQEEINWLFREFLDRPDSPNGAGERTSTGAGAGTASRTAGEVIELLCKDSDRKAIFEGSDLDYTSGSEADGRLFANLAYFCERDTTLMGEVAERSGRTRKKWYEKRGHTTWLGWELQKAADRQTETIDPKKNIRFSNSSGSKHSSSNGSAKTAHTNGDEESSQPQVVINGRHLHDVTTDAMDAVVGANDPPKIFVRTGALVRIALDEDSVPGIQRLSEAALRGRMDRVAEFVRLNKDKEAETVVPANPPKIVVEDAMALGQWEVPPIEAIVETPILRPDGTIFNEEGYDAQTRLYYHPATGFEMPAVSEHPTRVEVEKALATIDEAIGEFPFADEASAANARGLLLTPIIRQAIQGCVPLALIDKPQMGTGGSLFAEVASYIGIGRHAEMLGQPAHEDEWRKQITAKLDAGASMVTIDNVDEPLTSSNLSRALTARTWTDRRLGRSEEITLAQRATWLATGNNIGLGGDISRRCFWVRLDAQQAKPWEREGFRHPNLMAWVESHRGELVHALLTVARSWYTAGCPKDESLPRLGSFESWAETVGGMLAHAGIRGFLSNLDELYETADSETEEWTGFLEAWQSRLGEQALTARALAEGWIVPDKDFKAALPADLASALDDGTATFSRALGNTLKKVAGRRHGERGLHVHKHGTEKRSIKWRVSESKPQEGESDESSESPQPQRCSKPKEEELDARGNKWAAGETDSPDSLDSPAEKKDSKGTSSVERDNTGGHASEEWF